MNTQRFKVLPLNPLVVRDTVKETNIHLGSQTEARELEALLTSQEEKIAELKEKLSGYEEEELHG